jgi:circadian clock protein KaiC
MSNGVRIRKLSTGIQGLDTVLGGGVPEFSFNLIAGGPGCGKTTLAHQFMFANATDEKKAVYFTIFGEPPIKMLRYQQQFGFFDASKVGGAIRFVHLGKEMIDGGLDRVMEGITREIDAVDARTVVVDSFRSVARTAMATEGREEQMGLERFVQLLALQLTAYEATTFLVGEYAEQETSSNPIFTVADGIVWLYQTVIRNSAVRRLQAMKMRGAAPVPGLHTIKLTDDGMRVFPRLAKPEEWSVARSTAGGRQKTGIAGLDEMLHGGIPAGYSMLVAGPSGSGKSMLATQFILEGVRAGEPAVLAIFEKRPDEYLRTVPGGPELERLIAEEKMKLVYIRPLDLSVDEALEELQDAITRMGAKRVVIDSLSGFELALAPPFSEDFRESLYRMVGALTNMGVTLLLTVELTESFTELRLSPQGASFLTDGIILQRYVEVDGSLKKVMAVIKMRASDHSKELREYRISERGLEIGGVFRGQRGALTGTPQPRPSVTPRKRAPAPAVPRARANAKSKRRAR